MRKNSLLFAALMTTATIAWAQVGELTTLSESRITLKSTTLNLLYGSDTSSLIVKQGTSYSLIETLGSKIDLVRYDSELKEKVRLSLESKDNRQYLTGFNNNESIDMLFSEKNADETQLNVYHERLSPTTLKPMGEMIPLASLTGEKGDNLGFICRQSPNMQLTSGLFITQREGQWADARVSLYDRHFKEYWSMSTRLRTINFISVTDSGEVIIGGWLQQKVTGKSDFEIIVLDGENNHTYNFTVDAGTLSEVEFANYRDGKLYFLAIGQKKGSTGADRIISLCYNTTNKEITSDSYTFNSQEIQHMNDNSKYAGRSPQDLRFLTIENIVPAPDGHYDVLLTQTWTIRSQSSLDRATSGIMIATVRTDATFKRVHIRPFETSTVTGPQESLKQYRLLRSDHGALLLYSQCKKKANRNPSKMAGYIPLFHKSVLTAIYIPDEGEIRVQHIPTKKFCMINTPVPMGENKFILFLRSFKKLRIATFSLQ